MKLSVMQENLARGLSVVSRAVSSRSSLPVLANVLLRTEDAGLKLTATNLEIGITSWVPGKIETEGALTVPARLLTDVVGGLPAGERVDLEVENGTTLSDPGRALSRPTCGASTRTSSRSSPRPASDPPRASARRCCARRSREVAFAAASDEARPILTGVLTRFSGDRLTLAAADNYRIAVKSLRCPVAGRGHQPGRPRASYTELMRVLADTDDPVDIMLAPATSQVIFHVDTIDLVSRLIDGQFPNYQQVVPTSHSTRAVVDRDELLKAVRLSALIAASAANVVKLRIGEEGSAGITIAAAADVGDAEGQVEAALEGDPVTVAFNARYLTEALQNVDGGPAGAGAQRAALVGRVQAHRRCRLRPRRSCPSAPPPSRSSEPRGHRRPRRAVGTSLRASGATASWRSTSRRDPRSWSGTTPPARPTCSRRWWCCSRAHPTGRPPTRS